ncbi:MAG: heparinase II/III family protein [Armatimonadetes bacterium]|nr:heparinase II/III family protein [Armatimonadota bacterium]
MPTRWPIVLVLMACMAPAQAQGETPDWVRAIRPDHPRLFLNADTWPAVRAMAEGEMAEHYARVKAVVDKLPAEPEMRDWGQEANDAAFVWLMTHEPKYLALTQRLLDASLAFYHDRIANKVMVNWYSHTRVQALTAWDWIFADAPADWRAQWGRSMLDHVAQVQPYPGWRNDWGSGRTNRSGYTTGFYGTQNLLWFAGLAMYGEGIDDERALDFLVRGRELNMKLLAHRSKACGDDGGSASPTLGYAMGAYPWAEFNFLHTWESATGENLAPQWPYIALFANYVLWNHLPGTREFGYGDAYHTTNRMTRWNMCLHMAQTMHFYSETQPEWVALARYVQGLFPTYYGEKLWGCHPFLLTRMHLAPEPRDPGLLPHARHFENMGQVFMRSGSGEDDTYALLAAGGILKQHRHYDAGHFSIFHKGFLAIDSGTRAGNADQLQNYYAQTVAHNCILIDMPDEPVADYWNGTVYVMEGGQYQQIGSEVAAFETNDYFSYVAADCTRTYRPEKCELALRQFVFIHPNHFVILDRVRSTEPTYRKRWLLHTAREPVIEGATIRADQGEGRMFCRTILPVNAHLEAIGGEGKRFMAGGRNWPLPEKPKYGGKPPEYSELMGWGRIEVSDPDAGKDAIFLHVIQVGDQALEAMTDTERIARDGAAGVAFTAGNAQVRITFATDGDPAGHIRIERDGQTVMDRDFTREVQPQAGLASPGE